MHLLIPDVWRLILSWVPALSVHAASFASACRLFSELARRQLSELKAIACPPMGALPTTRLASSLEHLRLTNLPRSLPSDFFSEMPALRLRTFVSDDNRTASIVLRAASTLFRLDVSGMKRVSSFVIARLAREKQPALPELVVFRCARCGLDGAVSVTHMTPKLEGLDMGFCPLRVPVTLDHITYILQCCPFLVHLDIQMARAPNPSPSLGV